MCYCCCCEMVFMWKLTLVENRQNETYAANRFDDFKRENVNVSFPVNIIMYDG